MSIVSIPLEVVVKAWFGERKAFIEGHKRSGYRVIAVDLKRGFILLERRG